MKMELIGENKLKIELFNTDLEERDIKITEIAIGGTKARELFRDIIEEAHAKFEFNIEEEPIMVEAMPLSKDSIRIVVTKITNEEEVENTFDNMFTKDKNAIPPIPVSKDRILPNTTNEKLNILIFSFNDMDTTARAARSVTIDKTTNSSLFKDNLRFFLLVENENENLKNTELLFNEYGTKHISDEDSKSYLLEHSKVIIKKNAINILSEYL